MRRALRSGLCAVFFLAFGLTALGQKVAVFMSRDIAPYQKALDGVKGEMPGAQFEVFDMKGKLSVGEDLYRTSRSNPPDVYLAVGSLALKTLSREKQVPVFFTMVLNPERKFDPAQANINGVSLNPDLDKLFGQTKELLPESKQVGVIYSSKNSSELVAQGTKAAPQQGFTLVKREINGVREVPSALRSLLDQVDVLWLVPDKAVISDQSMEFIVVEATKRGIPIIGPSERYTREGALFALDTDHEAIGSQAGKLLKNLLNDEQRNGPVHLPDRFFLSLNTKVAKILGIRISSQVRSRARVVIE